MHVQIVTFTLDGTSEREYIDIASRLAPQFSAVPGLLAKVWLEDPGSGVYGSVYLWEDKEAMDRFLAGDLFEGTNRAFANFVSEDFAVLENLTRATQPVLTLLEQAAGPTVAAPAREAFPKKLAPARKKVTGAPKAAATKAPAAKAPSAAKKPKVTKVAPAAPSVRARTRTPRATS